MTETTINKPHSTTKLAVIGGKVTVVTERNRYEEWLNEERLGEVME